MEIALNLSLLVLLFGNLIVDLLALGAKFLDACETREKDWDGEILSPREDQRWLGRRGHATAATLTTTRCTR